MNENAVWNEDEACLENWWNLDGCCRSSKIRIYTHSQTTYIFQYQWKKHNVLPSSHFICLLHRSKATFSYFFFHFWNHTMALLFFLIDIGLIWICFSRLAVIQKSFDTNESFRFSFQKYRLCVSTWNVNNK